MLPPLRHGCQRRCWERSIPSVNGPTGAVTGKPTKQSSQWLSGLEGLGGWDAAVPLLCRLLGKLCRARTNDSDLRRAVIAVNQDSDGAAQHVEGYRLKLVRNGEAKTSVGIAKDCQIMAYGGRRFESGYEEGYVRGRSPPAPTRCWKFIRNMLTKP